MRKQYPPQYKKIDGQWYQVWATYRTKQDARKAVDYINKLDVFSARLVTLAQKYRTATRKYAVYRRGKQKGIVYDKSCPSPKNPRPSELIYWLGGR